MKTFDNGNINVTVCEQTNRPTEPGLWTAETYLNRGVWRWVRVNGESAAMRGLHDRSNST